MTTMTRRLSGRSQWKSGLSKIRGEVTKAYRAARSARFEHGETPIARAPAAINRQPTQSVIQRKAEEAAMESLRDLVAKSDGPGGTLHSLRNRELTESEFTSLVHAKRLSDNRTEVAQGAIARTLSGLKARIKSPFDKPIKPWCGRCESADIRHIEIGDVVARCPRCHPLRNERKRR